MIIGYLRETALPKSLQTQRSAIRAYAKTHGITIGRWVIEPLQSDSANSFTMLNELTAQIRRDDVILTTEVTNLSSSMQSFLEFLNAHFTRQGIIQTVEEGYTLSYDSTADTFADNLDLLSRITHQFSTRRSRNAVASGRRRGTRLGRPTCVHTSPAYYLLVDRLPEIRTHLASGMSRLQISKLLNVSYATLYRFLQENL